NDSEELDQKKNGRSSLPRTFIRLNDLSGLATGPGSPAPDGISVAGDEGSTQGGGESLPYPTLAPVVFFYLKQTTRPRSWCLKMKSLKGLFIPSGLGPPWKLPQLTGACL
uniref:Uncharacterized protein n=1 Tax=Xiphophorus couchianus TaxID=32473 RepID=A0A3B5L612_9TELE